MPTSETRLTVYNLALDLIREAPLQALTENAAAARWLNRNWSHTVEMNLQRYDWDFARERHVLSRDGTDPAFKWRYRYALPPGWLQVRPFYPYGDDTQLAVRHEVMGEYIETNEVSPIYVNLTMRRPEPGTWTPLFVEIIRCSLALGMAGKFPGKTRFAAEIRAQLGIALNEAEAAETLQSTSDPVEQHDIIRVRR